MKIEIGERSYIFMGTRLFTKGSLKIGDGTTINEGCRLDNRGGVAIGSNVDVASEACILTADHDVRSPSGWGSRERPVVIESYAFIGTRALILPGIRIGEGAVVAAGAIVTKDVAPYAIVAGNPARKIGERPRNLTHENNNGRLFH